MFLFHFHKQVFSLNMNGVNLKKLLKIAVFRSGILYFFLFLGCAHANTYQKWEVVPSPVANAPAVVEFFSFYCSPCYAFSETMEIDSAIRDILPKGDRMVKYHVSQLGPLGPELTRAWALAMIINKTDVVEKALS